jgi:hypothetical protein
MTTLFQIYMDDSGNVDPGATNDHNQRYGSISAVILESAYLDSTFNASFAKLVERHFGTKSDGTPHNLHRRVLNSPPEHGPFSILRDEKRRAAWDADAISMFSRAKYTVISASVDKIEWYWRYPNWSGDFYEVLVQAVLERSYYFLRTRGRAEVNIETKNQGRDQRLKEHYRNSLSTGFTYINGSKLSSVFSSKELNIVTKLECKPGAQLADLIAGPALQHTRFTVTKRHPITGDFVKRLCDILENEKFYRNSYGPNGYGRLWRPRPLRS